MGLLDRLIGHADVEAKSAYNCDSFLAWGKKFLALFKFTRDEVAVTNNGVFPMNVQGLMGSKKEYKYFALKAGDGHGDCVPK